MPTPYVVQTIAPGVPNLPSVNLPELPQVTVPDSGALPSPNAPLPQPNAPGPQQVPQGYAGSPSEYDVDAPQQVVPVDAAAAAAFDPSRYSVSGESGGGPDRAGSGGAGGQPGGYDGASVPVFGQLSGLDDASLDQQAGADRAADQGAGRTLPAAALVAVIALATVTAALVRTHSLARSSR